MIYETGKFAALSGKISVHVLHVTKEARVAWDSQKVT